MNTNRNTENLFNKNGFIRFKIKKNLFNKLKKKLVNQIKKNTQLKKINLSTFHKDLNVKDLNNLRIKLYNAINKDSEFERLLFLSCQKYIELMVGSELCRSPINLAIQYPKDRTSLLPMHTDFFSGESIFQINLWLPFVSVKKNNSMFIIRPKDSIKILSKIKVSKKILFKQIEKAENSKLNFITASPGDAILFSPNCLHGNMVNTQNTTRWSINIRYKNIFSPYNKINENEKKIGIFYKIKEPKLVTKFNLIHNFDEIIK